MKNNGVLSFLIVIIVLSLISPVTTVFASQSYENGGTANQFSRKINVEETNLQQQVNEKLFQIDSSIDNPVSSVIGNTYMYGNKEVDLYITFAEPEQALISIHQLAPNLLKRISNYYSLSKLTHGNWKEYYSKYIEFVGSNENNVAEDDEENMMLGIFFDIYENDEENLKAIHYMELNEPTKIHSLDSKTGLSELELLLPYDTSESTFNIDLNIPLFATTRAYSQANAIAYASKHATYPNFNTYQYFGSDCTNFASQILEAAGVSQVRTGNQNSGWWHILDAYGHTHSVSWINANTFCRYMGVGYKSNNFSNFSNNITTGDFIAFDKGKDGSWDHVAFVTAIGSNTNGYRDFKVAQHTKDYHAWVSSSTNGWETLGVNYNLGRVRR